jgi:hypothetical protein
MIDRLEAPARGVAHDLSPAALLASIKASRDLENAEAARQLTLAAAWADLHPPESIHDAASFTVPGCEHEEPIAGEGAPLVAEFCVAELGTTLGISTRRRRSSSVTPSSCATASRGCGHRSTPVPFLRGGPARSRTPPSTPHPP